MRATAVCAVISALVPATAAAGKGINSVSSPPPAATKTVKLVVRGARGRVDVFAAASRSHRRTDVRLAHGARVVKGKLVVSLAKLRAGVWYLIVCPASTKGRCAASATPTVVAPASAPPLPRVTPTIGSGAVTGASDANGLRLDAKAADGTTFTLVVPAGSLPSGTTVTMTPLAGMSGGAQDGRFVAGVQLAPDVPLAQGAALVVRPSAKLALSKAWLGVLTGEGTTLTRAAFRPTASNKGFGTRLGTLRGVVLLRKGGKGRGIPRARPRDAGSGDLTGFYQGLIGGLIGEEYDNTLSESDGTRAIVGTLEDWHAEIISSEFAAAKSDDAAADQFVSDLLDWAHTGALALGDGHTLVGGEDSFEEKVDGMSKYFGHAETKNNWELEQLWAYIVPVVRNKYLRAQARCANHDLSAFKDIVADNQQLYVMSGGDDVRPDSELMGCLHFNVVFDSTMVETHTGGATGTFTHEYVTKTDVSPTANKMSGTSTGSYAQATGELDEPATCHNSPSTARLNEVGGTGSSWSVDNLDIPVLDNAPAPGTPITLQVTYGTPAEHYMGSVDGCGSSGAPDHSFWAFDFEAAHKVNGSATFTLDGASGATIATKTYDQTIPLSGESVAEHTVITVTHTPVTPPTQ